MRALIGRAIRWFLDAVPAREVRLRMDEAAAQAVRSDLHRLGNSQSNAPSSGSRS